MKNNSKIDFTILEGILIFIIIFSLFYSFSNNPIKEKNKTETHLSNQQIINPLPQPIKKPADILNTEQTTHVKREFLLNKDGSITITAKLEGLSKIPDNVTLNDFNEQILFEKHLNLLNGKITALNGYLFPQNNSINLSNYGPGPKNQKSTRINITLLDLNFNKNTTKNDLYKITFKPDTEIEELSFASTELRSGEFILQLKEENQPHFIDQI